MDDPHVVCRPLPSTGGVYQAGGLVEGADFRNLKLLVDQGYLRPATRESDRKLKTAELLSRTGAPVAPAKEPAKASEPAAGKEPKPRTKRGGKAA